MRLQSFLRALFPKLRESVMAALPVCIIVIVLCGTLLFGQMAPATIGAFGIGAVMLIIGIALFTLGADVSMMPMGEQVGRHLTKSRKVWLIALLCFLIGMIVTIAEPDLKVLADQVPIVDSMVLILAVAVGIGLFLVIAFLRILLQIRLSWILIGCYMLVFGLMLSPLIPDNFTAIAFDAGGVTTGPMTVPFIMALGLGLASLRGDKTSEEDSFGLVALCSVGPILTVLLLGACNDTSGMTAESAATVMYDSMRDVVMAFWHALPEYAVEVAGALLPVVGFFILYQLFALHLPMRKLAGIAVGLVYTALGLIIFLTGVNVGFMPMGYEIGRQLAAGSFAWTLVPLGALIGCCIVAAEPAVHVLKKQVEDITEGGISAKTMGLALAIGVAVSAGVSMLRVLTGIPLLYILLPCYAAALVIAFFVPPIFTSVSFDAGGVASGPMTATFLLPLAQGACEAVGGNALTDAFGVVAMVAMTPLLTIQMLGLIAKLRSRTHTAAPLIDLSEGALLEFEIDLDEPVKGGMPDEQSV